MPAETVQQENWRKAHETQQGATQTDTVQQFAYSGWLDLLKDVDVKTPEGYLEASYAKMDAAWKAKVAAHSPIDPAAAAAAGLAFEVEANAAHLTIVAGLTALEVLGFGQIETPALTLAQAPALGAMWDSARAVRRAYFDAAITKGVTYYANAQHLPTIIPEQYLINAVNMGIIDDVLYQGQMLYHGYSMDRAGLMAMTEIHMPDLPEIIDLLRRGVLSDVGAIDWLLFHKYPVATAEALVSLQEAFPEPYRLAEMYSKGVLEEMLLDRGMEVAGLNKGWSTRWVKAMYVNPTFEQATTMNLRGIIDDATWTTYMRRSGYNPDSLPHYKALREVIPPINDLIRFAVREAFPVPAGQPQFEQMSQWAAKQGLTPYWVDKYWLAHFNRMGLSQAYENLWRGHFDIDDFEYYMLLADIHPDDWEAIENVAFRPPNVRELGYGFDVGVYSRDDIIKYRRWGGLSPEDATKAADSLIAYRLEAERNAIRTEYVHGYAKGQIALEQVKTRLQQLQTAEPAIALWLERAQLERQRLTKPELDTEGKIPSSAEIIGAWKQGVIVETDVRRLLKALDWTDERINLVVAKTMAEMLPETKEAKPTTYRNLTLSLIKQMYDLNIATAAELPALIETLGYTKANAQLLATVIVDLAEKAAEPRLLTKADISDMYDVAVYSLADVYDAFTRLNYSPDDAYGLTLATAMAVEVPKLKAIYSKGWIQADQLYQEFLSLGLSQANANELMMTIVKAEQPARLAPERDLTKAEIVKGAKSGVITTTDAVGLLMDMGYDQFEAYYILAINKVVSAGDPENYWDMKRVVEAYKKATGGKSMEITDEMIALQTQIRQIQTELDKERKIGANETKIAELAIKLSGVQLQFRHLLEQRTVK